MVPVGGYESPYLDPRVPSGGFKNDLVSLVVVAQGPLVKVFTGPCGTFGGKLEKLEDHVVLEEGGGTMLVFQETLVDLRKFCGSLKRFKIFLSTL